MDYKGYLAKGTSNLIKETLNENVGYTLGDIKNIKEKFVTPSHFTLEKSRRPYMDI